jgi:hypothetical protein
MFMWFFFLSPSLECSEMNTAQPIFDPATGYRIELRGRVDQEWLQSFDSSIEILIEYPGQPQEFTVLHVHTDQSGMIGLLRRLHGLGMTIQQIQVMTGKEVE